MKVIPEVKLTQQAIELLKQFIALETAEEAGTKMPVEGGEDKDVDVLKQAIALLGKALVIEEKEPEGEDVKEAGARNSKPDATRLTQIRDLCDQLLGTSTLSGQSTGQDPTPDTLTLNQQSTGQCRCGKADCPLCNPDLNSDDPNNQAGAPSGVDHTHPIMKQKTDIKEGASEGEDEIVEAEMVEKIILESKSVDKKKNEAIITIIKEGGGNAKDNHYYPASTLMRDANLFEGTKMYVDHLTAEQEKKLGGLPRSVNDWVATIKESWWDEASREIRGRIKVVKPWFMDFLTEAKDDVGVSIRGRGKVTPNKKVGNKIVNVVESLLKPKSVDFVTEAGAGGKVLELLEAQIQIQEDEKMFKEMTSDQIVAKLQESRPEVLVNIQEGVRSDSQPKLNAIAKRAITASISESVKTTDLPQASKEKLISDLTEAVSVDAFVAADDCDTFIKTIVEGAILKEKTYIAKLNESNVITGMGSSTTKGKLTSVQSMSKAFGRKEDK